MNSYKLLFDWQISMPDNWQGEYDKKSSQYIFYPDNSDLTIRITPFHAERDGILAPREVMEDAYIRTVPVSARQRNLDFYNNKTFRVAHRISSFTPNCTYKVNDVVELRVYEDKPDKAIVNSKKNLIMPLVSGISSIILGIVFVIIYALFK